MLGGCRHSSFSQQITLHKRTSAAPRFQMTSIPNRNLGMAVDFDADRYRRNRLLPARCSKMYRVQTPHQYMVDLVILVSNTVSLTGGFPLHDTSKVICLESRFSSTPSQA